MLALAHIILSDTELLCVFVNFVTLDDFACFGVFRFKVLGRQRPNYPSRRVVRWTWFSAKVVSIILFCPFQQHAVPVLVLLFTAHCPGQACLCCCAGLRFHAEMVCNTRHIMFFPPFPGCYLRERCACFTVAKRQPCNIKSRSKSGKRLRDGGK